MSNLSEVAMSLILNDLRSLGDEYGFKIFATVELDPVDPESTYSVTLMRPDAEFSAKFLGRTNIGALRGALDYVKLVAFSSGPSHQSPQQPE